MKQKRKDGKNNNNKVTKPNVILNYNVGVNLQDSYLSSFSIMRKFAKGYRKRFFYLMDMTFFNAVRKITNIRKTKKYSFSKFRDVKYVLKNY